MPTKRKKQTPAKKISRLLIANRGEIACRIIHTARELGIETVAVYSEPDREAAHVTLADRAVALGGDSAATSYLDGGRIVDAAVSESADAVHPGYGFLAENAVFARAVDAAGLAFVGPTADTIELMGDKISARSVAIDCGLPVIANADLDGNARANARAAASLGFPVLVKAAAGGGGRGMRVVAETAELEDAVAAARRETQAAFGDGRVYLEKYIAAPRHIEVQVFGDAAGTVAQLGERDCSVQRRYQKIIEEAPAPSLDRALADAIAAAAVRLAEAIGYRSAGTVEFVVDDDGDFYFLEMNTRLQVEHAVTELVTATDLVRWQLEVAAGGDLPAGPHPVRGHAVECRVYAEDPAGGFLPTAGRVHRVEHPSGPGVRVDSALYDGFDVRVEYDPLLAKVIAWAPDREHAIRRMVRALEGFAVVGVTTNIAFLIDVLSDDDFTAGAFKTTSVEERYGTWRRAREEPFEVACAAAALLTGARGSLAKTGPGSAAVDIPGPWDTLGAWRLGTARG